jgi:hypothetical protein
MAIVLIYTFPLAARRAPNRLAVVGGLLATGLAMLFFVEARGTIYNRGTWQEAIQNVSLEKVVTTKASQVEDNEFVYNCFMVATNCETGLYQYGTGYLSLLTHWVPHSLWPEKPRQGQGWFPDALPYMKSVTGREMSVGAAIGGVAEVFNQFGWASPVFWFLLGWLAAWIYARARDSGNARWGIAFVGLVATMHWLVSQGFTEAFVPGAIYQAVPFLVFGLTRSHATTPAHLHRRPQLQQRLHAAGNAAEPRRTGLPST